MRHERKDLADAVDHLRGGRALDECAVEVTAELEVIGFGQEMGRDYPRADGAERVEAFSAKPTRDIGVLDIALADIVKAGEAKDAAHCVLDRDVFAGAGDDEGKLGLVVAAGLGEVVGPKDGGDPYGLPIADEDIGGFGEEDWLGDAI